MHSFWTNFMKASSRRSAAFCLIILLPAAACRKEDKPKPAAAAQPDTMLLRDLAEANRNTATLAAADNSLNTVRTDENGAVQPVTEEVPRNRPSEVKVAPRLAPSGSQILTSGPRIAAPIKANDAPSPTTVSLDRSPASRTSTSSSGDPCDSPAAIDQRTCLNRSIVANDADLNRTYQDLIVQARKSGGSDLEERFRQSQRDWINQRDGDCRQSQSTDGRLWARARARCLADYSAKRTAELQRNLSSLRGQGQ